MSYYQGDVPLKSTVLLGPLGQYEFYNTFPWGFLIHVAIVCVASLFSFE